MRKLTDPPSIPCYDSGQNILKGIFGDSVLSLAAASALAIALTAYGQVNVLTYQYDNTRAGANTQEIILNKSNVNSTQFGKRVAYPVDGYIYGQPLYLANVIIPNKGNHNVVYVATEHDSVYAFDADGGSGSDTAPLWHVNFLNPAAGVTTVPYEDTECGQITPEIGITSTPVIDTATGTIFVVAMTKEAAGSAPRYLHRLHALDVASGAEKPGSPVIIQASYPGTGEGGSILSFNAKNYKQRPGLLLLGGTVYTAWSSHCDIGNYHGWLIGYDSASLRQTVVYNDTPNGNEGSFWASGAAPAVDSSGNIYVVSANGSFNPGASNFGESYIKLSSTGGLQVTDYFTPFNYDDLNTNDVDTGSAGVALIGDEAGSPDHPHLMVGAGKEGRIYLLDRDNLGKLNGGSDSQIVQSMMGAIAAVFGNPAYFNKTIYFCGSGDTLKAFSILNGQMSTSPVSQTNMPFGYPGCVPTISANGQDNAIVWIIDPGGALRAYDASNLASELYNSTQNQARDHLEGAVKFTVPAVANGKVYAGTYNSLNVYGLLSGGTITVSNAATGDTTAVAPGSIASIYGSGLSATSAVASEFPITTALGGSTVTVNGIAAPIFYASSTQINFQIPFEVATGRATFSVIVNSTPAGSTSALIQPTAPGLFGQSPGPAAIVNPDGSLNSQSQPAATGSVIAAYMTGLGAVDPPVAAGAAAGASPLSGATASVTATMGSTSASVLYAGLAPGFAGLYQVNIQIPPLATGQYPLQISVAGVPSNAVTVNVR